MHPELQLWQFIADRLERGENVMLLVVAESSGSSPGRPGYKMAVGSDGRLTGSIGGGVMEVSLVEQSRKILTAPPAIEGALTSFLKPQVHLNNKPNSSGMICSGRQTVIFRLLRSEDLNAASQAIDSLSGHRPSTLKITPEIFSIKPPEGGTQNAHFDFHLNTYIMTL